jgi:cytochrome c-type biogenesis protein CcmF
MTDKNDNRTKLTSEIRRFPVARSQTTEAAIKSGFLGDVYVVYGGGTAADGFVIRIYQKPLITWIWGGAGLMMLGGLLAMGSRVSGGSRRQEQHSDQQRNNEPSNRPMEG